QNQTATINKVTSTLSRGNFFGNVYPGNAVNNYGSATDCAYMEIAIHNKAENTLRFNGEVKSLHGEAECVKLTNSSVSSTRANILFGENAYLKLDEYSNNETVYKGGTSEGGAVKWSGHVCAGKDSEGNDVATVPGTIANAKISKYQPIVVDTEKAPNGLIPGKVYIEYPRVERTFVLTCSECGYELSAPMTDVGIKLYGNASDSEEVQKNVALDGLATVEKIEVEEIGKKADGTEISTKDCMGYMETPATGTIHYYTVRGTENGKKYTAVENPEDYPDVPTEALNKDSDPLDELTDDSNMVHEEKKLTTEGLNQIIKVNDLMDQYGYTNEAPKQNEEFTQSLREQVVNYFELQTAFTWTPDQSQKKYKTTNLKGEIEVDEGEDGTQQKEKDGVDKYIDQGALYGGIPYQSHGNGNLYRWMEYYDETTGIFYLSQMMQDNGGYSADGTFNPGSDDFYNQCSNGANWSWMRACNTGFAQGSMSFGVSRGMIPVGGFTYFNEGTKYGPDSEFKKTMTGHYFDNKYQCQYITKTELGNITYYVEDPDGWLNDEKEQLKVYDYYALAQPGDCISKSGHVMMAVKVDVQYKTVLSSAWGNSTKQIVDPELSTISMVEQIEGWGRSSAHGYDTSTGNDKAVNGTSTWNGYNYTRQGRARYDKNGTYTFKELADAGYLPFTFIEFQNFDPATQTEWDKTHIEFYNTYILPDVLDNVLTARYSKNALDLRNVSVYDPETGTVIKNQSLISKGDLVNLDGNGKLTGGTEKSFVKIGFSAATGSNVLDKNGAKTKIVATEPTITFAAENISKMTYNNLQNFIVYSNYFISDITTTFTNKNGTVLLEKTSRASNNAVSMVNHPGIYDSSVDLQTGENKVTISVQLSTGEKIVLLKDMPY
ncbi:MAG: hypothetical protein IKD18_02445, partial [Clostridia bacterium]|nr:hypothetical protein [Clostridia bacterium]